MRLGLGTSIVNSRSGEITPTVATASFMSTDESISLVDSATIVNEEPAAAVPLIVDDFQNVAAGGSTTGSDVDFTGLAEGDLIAIFLLLDNANTIGATPTSPHTLTRLELQDTTVVAGTQPSSALYTRTVGAAENSSQTYAFTWSGNVKYMVIGFRITGHGVLASGSATNAGGVATNTITAETVAIGSDSSLVIQACVADDNPSGVITFTSLPTGTDPFGGVLRTSTGGGAVAAFRTTEQDTGNTASVTWTLDAALTRRMVSLTLVVEPAV